MGQAIICSHSLLVRRNLRMILEAYGHPVLEAEDTVALMATAMRHKVQLVVLDEDHKQLPATAAIQLLRAHGPTAHVMIVALGLEREPLLAAGANHVLPLPFKTQLLEDVLELLALQDRLGLPG